MRAVLILNRGSFSGKVNSYARVVTKTRPWIMKIATDSLHQDWEVIEAAIRGDDELYRKYGATSMDFAQAKEVDSRSRIDKIIDDLWWTNR